jgi:NAD(P)-dependent dehydrogenase (short-subunit alcohol dehydrogenase family)
MYMTKEKQKVAVLTGSTGFLGSAITKALTDKGWIVAGLSREGGSGVYQCDVGNESEVQKAAAEILKTYDSVDACIHAAASRIENKRLVDIGADFFDESMETAARGAFLLARAFTPHMGRGAAFIGITSNITDPNVQAMPMGAYIPAKYALRGLLRVLANDLKDRGIRVYALSPGFLPGGLNQSVPKPILELLAKKTGAGSATVKDVVNVIVQLLDEEERYQSGTSISIPGDVVPL